jgi:hypothetical protein
LGAAAEVEGAKTRGNVDGSPVARTVIRGEVVDGVNAIATRPVLAVFAVWPPVTESETPGTGLPAADSTRTYARAGLPTVSAPGSRASILKGPW